MKLKASWLFSYSVIFFVVSSCFGEKFVEVVVPIAKLHFLPSASSDTRGYVRKGQRYTVDGESGLWYRVRLYGAALWITKDAVAIIEKNPESPASVSAPSETLSSAVARKPLDSGRPGQPLPAPGKASLAESGASSSKWAEQPADSSQSGESFFKKPSPAQSASASTKPNPSPSIALHSIFSNLSHIPRTPSGEPGKEITFFQISVNETPIYSLSDTTAKVLSRVRKGDYFPFLEEANAWCKIALNDTIGWVERSKGAIVSAPQSKFLDEFLLIIIIAAVLLTAFLVLLTALLARRNSRTKQRRVESFCAFIIAKSAPSVLCIISKKTISLDKYLSAIGFTANIIHTIGNAKRRIGKHAPDAVFIDWNLSDDIPGAVEELFEGYETKKLPLVIFFNVPDTPLIPTLPRTFYLGKSFSDHDISKLITPTMLSKTSPRTGSASALEGDIAEGNLPEIMQFIELGKKNGCLLVETESPIGMIYFQQGRIVHAAAANGVTGKQAITSLLALKQGKFRFLLNKQPKTVDFNLSTLEVLMEWTKIEDETHRD